MGRYIIESVDEQSRDIGTGEKLTSTQVEEAEIAKSLLQKAFEMYKCNVHSYACHSASLWYDHGQLKGKVRVCCDKFYKSLGPVINVVLGFPVEIRAAGKKG